MWLTSILCIISALSLLGVIARWGHSECVSKSSWLINGLYVALIDGRKPEIRSDADCIVLPGRQATYLSVQLTSRSFLDSSFVFHPVVPFVSLSQSPITFMDV